MDQGRRLEARQKGCQATLTTLLATSASWKDTSTRPELGLSGNVSEDIIKGLSELSLAVASNAMAAGTPKRLARLNSHYPLCSRRACGRG